MPDYMADTFVTVDAAGNVTFNFTGIIHSLGLVIPEGSSPTSIAAALANQVAWQRGSVTEEFVSAYGSLGPGNVLIQHLVMAAFRTNPGSAFATGQVVAAIFDPATNLVLQSGVLLDDLGASDFYLLPATGTIPAGVAGQVLTSQGPGVNPAFATITAPTAIYKTNFDVVNTAAETNLISQALPVLGANGSVLVFVEADYFNNSGGARTLTPRVKLGATTLWGDAGPSLAAGATHRVFALTAQIQNEGATNVQRLGGNAAIGTANAGSVAGIGNWANASAGLVDFGGASAVDTTQAQTLAVSVQWSAANASLELKGSVLVLVFA